LSNEAAVRLVQGGLEATASCPIPLQGARVKVLVLTTIMAPYRVNLFNELGQYCELTVCFEQQHDESRERNWFVQAGHRFKSVPLKHWDRSVGRVKLDIIKRVSADHYDLAIAYEYSTITGMLFLLLCKLKKIPYLINCDGAFIENHPIRDLIKRFFIKGAAACLANGEHAKNYFLNFGARADDIYGHHFTSLHARDISASVPSKDEKVRLREELGWPPHSKIVITVGRFIKSKRIDVLIAAWTRMHPDWLCVIVGSGELEQDYRRQIERLSLGNILFTGHQDPESLKKMYLAADLFVLPTESDVWGLVVNEAFACGLPVITTDKCIAGLELIQEGYNGSIVAVGDSEQLAGRIQALLSDEGEPSKVSAHALDSIKDYTYESVAQSHIGVMTRVMKQRQCHS
jgi:L-malate glycosyltransferase